METSEFVRVQSVPKPKHSKSYIYTFIINLIDKEQFLKWRIQSVLKGKKGIYPGLPLPSIERKGVQSLG